MLTNTKDKKTDILIATRWYTEVSWMLSLIQAEPKLHFSDPDLRNLGVYVTDLDLKEPRASSSDSQFFDPIPERKLPISSCSCSDPHAELPENAMRKKLSKRDPHFLGRMLRNVVFLHETAMEAMFPSKWMSIDFDTEYKEASKWTVDHRDKLWHLFGASTSVNTHKPHLILRLLTHGTGDERLLRSELLVLLNFIYIGIKRQISEYKSRDEKGEGGGLYAKVPILLISVINPAQIRVIQCHFDGMLKIKRSKLYDLDTPCHGGMMDLFIRWMRPRACGNTKVKESLTSIPEGPEVEAGDGVSQVMLV